MWLDALIIRDETTFPGELTIDPKSNKGPEFDGLYWNEWRQESENRLMHLPEGSSKVRISRQVSSECSGLHSKDTEFANLLRWTGYQAKAWKPQTLTLAEIIVLMESTYRIFDLHGSGWQASAKLQSSHM